MPVKWLAVMTLVGCATPEPDPAMELGTGELSYEHVVDGDELEVVYGPQGGYHFYGGAQLVGIEPGDKANLASTLNPTTRFEAWVDGVQLVLIEPFTQGYEAAPESAEPFTHELFGRLVIIDIEDDDEINGKTVHFVVEVTDHLGTLYRDEQDLVVVPNPYND